MEVVGSVRHRGDGSEDTLSLKKRKTAERPSDREVSFRTLFLWVCDVILHLSLLVEYVAQDC